MKIVQSPSVSGPTAPRRSEGGFITITFVVLLTIMMILVTAETRSVIHLRQETKLLEQRQVKRFNVPPASTTTNTILQPK